MADLQVIYENFGFQGIIPYAFQRGGRAYQFLTEKIKGEVPLYVVFSDATGVPYLDVMYLGPYVKVCSSGESANLLCDRLARSGEGAHAVKIAAAVEKEKAMLHIRDLGAIGIQIDDGVFVNIQDLVEMAGYDGFRGLDWPLRNAAMNSTLYLLCQKVAAGNAYQHLLLRFFRQVQSGRLLVPLAITDAAKGVLGRDDFIIPTMQAEDGYNLIPVFTDTFAFQYACENDRIIQESFPQQLTYVAEYRFLLELLTKSDEAAITVNPGTANLNIDRTTFLGLEAAATAEGSEKEINATDSEDPIPDFLK